MGCYLNKLWNIWVINLLKNHFCDRVGKFLMLDDGGIEFETFEYDSVMLV